MKTFFSKRKNIVISCVVAVVIIGGIIGGVIYNKHVKEKQAIELKIEMILADLKNADSAVAFLYSDETQKFLADGVAQEHLDSAKEALTTIKAYVETENLMQDEQISQYNNLFTEYTNAVSMHDIAMLYNSFYSSVEQTTSSVSVDSINVVVTSEIVEESQSSEITSQPETESVTPYVLEETDSTATNLTLLSEKLESIKEIKPEFYSQYIEKKTNLETELLTMRETTALVNSLFSEDGSVVESATSEQYDNAVAKVNELTNPTVKKELNAKLQTVTDTLAQRAQAQAEKEQEEANQKAQSTKSGTKSNTTNSRGNNASTRSSATNGSGNATANSQATNNNTNNGNQSNNTTNNNTNNATPTTPTQPTTPSAPTIISGRIGNMGLFNSMAELAAYAESQLDAEDSTYTGYTVVYVVYSDKTIKYSGDLYVTRPF